MYCKNCGLEIDDSAIFCGNCGNKILRSTPQQSGIAEEPLKQPERDNISQRRQAREAWEAQFQERLAQRASESERTRGYSTPSSQRILTHPEKQKTFCQYCGAELAREYIYCPKCMKQTELIEADVTSGMCSDTTKKPSVYTTDIRPNEDYIKNQLNIKKRSRLIGLTVLLSAIEIVFVLFSLVGVMAVPPLGIILLTGCFFFLKLIIKICKKGREIGKEIKNFALSTHRPSPDILRDTTYCFIAPFSTQTTLTKISEALSQIGEVSSTDLQHGVLKGTIQTSSNKKAQVTFYIERNDNHCKVRACFSKVANDDWWDWFLQALFTCSGRSDFGASLANGAPQIAGVLHIGDDTQQIHVSRATGGTSLTGFLVGGALFGVAGAVVGGMSGKQKTTGRSYEQFSNSQLARIIYNNGRIWEGTIQKGSALYNEIMVNMK